MPTVTNLGITPTTLSDYVTLLNAIFKDALGDDLITDPETPQGQLIQLLAFRLSRLDETIIQVANGMSLSRASGFQLDAYSELLNVSRKVGSAARIAITYKSKQTGSNVWPIAASDATITVNNASYTAEQSLVDSGGTDSIIIFKADHFGAAVVFGETNLNVVRWTGDLPQDTILDKLEVSSIIDRGSDEETDAEYRLRYSQSIAPAFSSTQEAIANAFTRAGLKHTVIANNSDAEITVESVPIAAHSFTIVAERPEDLTVIREVYDLIPGGIRVDLRDSIGTSWGEPPIAYEPITLNLLVEISAQLKSNFPSNGFSEVRRHVIEYINTLDIGAEPNTFDIVDAVLNVPGIALTAVPSIKQADESPLPSIDLRHLMSVNKIDLTIIEN